MLLVLMSLHAVVGWELLAFYAVLLVCHVGVGLSALPCRGGAGFGCSWCCFLVCRCLSSGCAVRVLIISALAPPTLLASCVVRRSRLVLLCSVSCCGYGASFVCDNAWPMPHRGWERGVVGVCVCVGGGCLVGLLLLSAGHSTGAKPFSLGAVCYWCGCLFAICCLSHSLHASITWCQLLVCRTACNTLVHGWGSLCAACTGGCTGLRSYAPTLLSTHQACQRRGRKVK